MGRPRRRQGQVPAPAEQGPAVAEAPPRRLPPSPRATAAAAEGTVPGLWAWWKGHEAEVTRAQDSRGGCRDPRNAGLGGVSESRTT